MEFTVSAEFIACILEINSELGCILEMGINDDSIAILELINNRLKTLVDEIGKGQAA